MRVVLANDTPPTSGDTGAMRGEPYDAIGGRGVARGGTVLNDGCGVGVARGGTVLDGGCCVGVARGGTLDGGCGVAVARDATGVPAGGVTLTPAFI